MSGPRRPHVKTRTGCKVCKRRKVKCDEGRPACGNCIKHAVECDYLASTQARAAAAPPRPQRESEDLPPVSSAQFGGLPVSAQTTQDRHGYEGLRPLQMVELQLLHHYTTSTCHTLQKSSTLRALWTKNIPELAFEHEYVMRGILALGALHLAHCQPDRRSYWLSQAIIQHQPASTVAISVMSKITADDYAPLYIFSVLTAFFSLGSPKEPGNLLFIGGNAEWLFLLRGTRSIVTMAQGSLDRTPLGPLMLDGMRRAQARFAERDQIDTRLATLEHYIRRISTPDYLPIYMHAIEELKQSYSVVFAQKIDDLELTDIFLWPNVVKDEFLVLLRQHTEESYVILAFYCVLLSRLEHHWWMQGWSMHLISQIYRNLSEDGRLIIQWPMQEIGWAPGVRG